MSEFATTVTGFTEKKADHSNDQPAKTVGGIVVRPPVHQGERFKDAVLGASPRSSIDVAEVATTEDATIFLVEFGKASLEERQADIRLVAERIGQLANNPEMVVDMTVQAAFPRPPQTRPM